MCRSPHLTHAFSMARHRRAGARGAVLRPSPLRGGWLRPGPPRWPACRCSAPIRGLRCGSSGGPHGQPRPLWGRGPLSPARGPRRLWGRALALRSRRPGVPPRRAPLRVACRWRGGSPPRRPSPLVGGALAVGGAPPGGASLCLPGGVFRRCGGGWRGVRRAGIQSRWLRHPGFAGAAYMRTANALAYSHAPHSLSASAYNIVTSGLSCCSAACTFARS